MFDVEGARKAGYTDAEIAAHLAQSRGFDAAGARKSGYSDAELISYLSTDQSPPVKPSAVARIADVVTGKLRETQETRELPEWTTMPELNEFSVAAAKTGLGTLLAPTAEVPKIIQAQYPNVKVRQDEKGNYILQSSVNGKEYAIPPGLSWGDLPRLVGGVAAFTPAGRATSLGGMAAAGGATQAVIEASQAATGGDFNPGDIATAAVLPPVAVSAVRGATAGANAIRQAMKPAPAAGAVPAAAVPPVAGAAPAVVQPAVPVAAPVAPMSAPKLAQTAREAAKGSTKARDVLAGQAMPDAEVVEAAKRLGILDNLQPDHVTTNQAYRELAQAVKSIPGSQARQAELQGLEEVAKRADDLVTQLGGADDVADLGVRLKSAMQGTQRQLEDQAEKLYGEVAAKIPAATPVRAENVVKLLQTTAQELGGAQRLSSVERRLLTDLSGENVTYAFLDRTRKQVGQATRSASGPFKDSESGLLKRLYSALADDQLRAAETNGAADVYRAAQASIRTRKGLEDDIVAIFGKALDRSLSPALASSVGKLAAGDIQGLARLIEATPASMRREVVASGLQYALTGGAKKQAVSFSTYARWYEGLRKNAPAYSLVARNLDDDALKSLNDLYKVSRGIAAASKERITTGRINAVAEELKGAESLVGRIYDVAKKSSVGLAAEAVTTPLGAPGAGLASGLTSALTRNKPDVMKAADAVISSPEFMKLAARHAATGVVDRGLVKRLAYSQAMKKLARELRDPKALSDPEQFILAAMQSGRQRESTAPISAPPARLKAAPSTE